MSAPYLSFLVLKFFIFLSFLFVVFVLFLFLCSRWNFCRYCEELALLFSCPADYERDW